MRTYPYHTANQTVSLEHAKIIHIVLVPADFCAAPKQNLKTVVLAVQAVLLLTINVRVLQILIVPPDIVTMAHAQHARHVLIVMVVPGKTMVPATNEEQKNPADVKLALAAPVMHINAQRDTMARHQMEHRVVHNAHNGLGFIQIQQKQHWHAEPVMQAQQH